MRARWITVAVVAALAGGCGGSDDESAPGSGASDREAVEAVAHEYLEALIAGDGERTCALLTEDAQEQVKTWTTASTCEDGIGQFGDFIDEKDADADEKLRDVSVEQVTVTGDKAEAQVESGDGSPRPASFEKVGDTWKVAGFPAGATFQSQAHAECVAGGMNQFDEGGGDPFWQKEGRKDFQEFIVETCARADAQGLLDGSGNEPELQRIAGRVLLGMVRSGQVRDPRRDG
jgi:Putative lumazine-binding